MQRHPHRSARSCLPGARRRRRNFCIALQVPQTFSRAVGAEKFESRHWRRKIGIAPQAPKILDRALFGTEFAVRAGVPDLAPLESNQICEGGCEKLGEAAAPTQHICTAALSPRVFYQAGRSFPSQPQECRSVPLRTVSSTSSGQSLSISSWIVWRSAPPQESHASPPH